MVVLALAAFGAGVPTWLNTAGSTALDAVVPVAVAGTQAAPVAPAAALVLLAAAGAIGLAGRIGRWVVVGVVAAAGLLLASSALAVIRDPEPVARAVVATATGIATLARPATLTLAPYATVGLGAAAVAAGVWLAATSRDWARPSARHESAAAPADAARTGPPATTSEPDDDQAAWDALSRGNDPT